MHRMMENKTVKQIWICVQHDFFYKSEVRVAMQGRGWWWYIHSHICLATSKKEISFKPVTWLKLEEGGEEDLRC